MPFTPAHPAAVLPLRDRFPRILPWSALVIGSVVPDFEYFFLGRVHAGSHSLPGLLRFCLPVGLSAWLLFHALLKRPILDLLPRGEKARLWPLAARRTDWSPATILAAGLAVLVGAASHLLWDAFTHAGQWGTEIMPVLSRTLLSFRGYDFTVFRLLQHGSTVVGLLLLANAYRRWRDSHPPIQNVPCLEHGWKTAAWILIIGVPLIAALFRALAGAPTVTDLGSLRPFVWLFVTSGLSFVLVAVLLYSLIASISVTGRLRRRMSAPPDS